MESLRVEGGGGIQQRAMGDSSLQESDEREQFRERGMIVQSNGVYMEGQINGGVFRWIINFLFKFECGQGRVFIY